MEILGMPTGPANVSSLTVRKNNLIENIKYA